MIASFLFLCLSQRRGIRCSETTLFGGGGGRGGCCSPATLTQKDKSHSERWTRCRLASKSFHGLRSAVNPERDTTRVRHLKMVSGFRGIWSISEKAWRTHTPSQERLYMIITLLPTPYPYLYWSRISPWWKIGYQLHLTSLVSSRKTSPMFHTKSKETG